MKDSEDIAHIVAHKDEYPLTPDGEAQTNSSQRLRYPIPSNDPNDPLNWPWYWKTITYGTIWMFSFVANLNASNFTVAVVPIMNAFKVDATRAIFLVTFNVLMFGLGNMLWMPLMRVIGKRPVYIMAIALMVVANAWSATAATWGSLLAARMVSGIGASAADATVPSAVADLFFLEQRGHCMMFSISRWRASWRYSCVFLAAASGLCLVLAILFIRETQYYKPRKQYADHEVPAPRSYVQWLSLSYGYNRDRPLQRFLTCLTDVIAMATYPPVLYVGCLIGTVVGWGIVNLVTISQYFLRAPYNFSLAGAGLFSLSGFVGVLISFFLAGKLIDFLSNRARRRDHTLKPRPEQRLLALVIPFCIGPFGLIIFGQVVYRNLPWIGAAFGYGMHSFSFAIISNVAITYAVDCYQNFAGEALVTVFVIRNVIALICSFYSATWIAQNGLATVFGTMAGVEWALLLLALIFFFYNARILAWTDTYGPQKRSLQGAVD